MGISQCFGSLLKIKDPGHNHESFRVLVLITVTVLLRLGCSKTVNC